MSIKHVFTNTVPDEAATTRVRPSDWNSAHAQALTIGGNTAGSSSWSGTDLQLNGGPNVTLSLTGNTLVMSAAAAALALALSAGAQSANSGTIEFANSNGISFGMSGSSQITASHNGLTSQSGQAFSAQGGSSAFQTLNFANANGLSFSNSDGSVVGSYTVPSVPAQSNQQMIVFAASNTTQGTSGTMNATSMVFAGAGVASVGVTGGSVVVSVPAGGGGGGVFVGASTVGNTAGSTGTVSTGNFVLVGSGPISLSQSTGAAGSAATLSIIGPATSSLSATGAVSISTNGSTISIGAPFGHMDMWEPGAVYGQLTTGPQIGQGSVFVFPAPAAGYVTASHAVHRITMTVSSSSNSSHAGVISMYVGIYTRNGSTLSLASSGSQAIQWTNTSSNSISVLTGAKLMSCPINVNASPGDYWVAMMTRTSTTNANWFTASNARYTAIGGQVNGLLGEASNITHQRLPGFGLYSATSSVLPASMAFTDIRGWGSSTVPNNFLPPHIALINFTA